MPARGVGRHPPLMEAALPHSSTTVAVDAQLQWVVRAPEALAGAARASSPAQLARFGAELNAMRAALDDAARTDIMLGAVARALIELLREPPELPFIGEPFGGEDGTD